MNLKKISRSDETANKNNGNNIFGEKKTPGRLIVMDVVSSLADESKNFASFLAVARKYWCSCVYEFYIKQTFIIFFLQQFLYLEFGKF